VLGIIIYSVSSTEHDCSVTCVWYIIILDNIIIADKGAKGSRYRATETQKPRRACKTHISNA